MNAVPLFFSPILSVTAFLLLQAPAFGEPEASPAPPKRIHVIVALCDNEYQGIVKVGAKIGNGDDLANNLYWGCSDGLWKCFDKSPDWKLTGRKPENEDRTILETLTFRHVSGEAILVAEAWRGREIEKATIRFFELLEAPKTIDSPDLVAFIGHNGLMDFTLPETAATPETGFKFATETKDAVVLCCKSRVYFTDQLKARGARPILMTEQLMYPGSFLLKAALDGWLKGEDLDKIRERAARAYAGNQKIGTRAARGVFSNLSEPE